MKNHNTTSYSPEFRAEMVRRMSGPHGVSANALARESGVAQVTLSIWLRHARSLPAMTSSKERSPDEKLRLVIAASALEGEELGAFLRREGIHDVEMRDWRKAMLDALAGGRPPPSKGPEQKRVRELEKELRRKDKALAEAAALVILKKKAQDYGWLAREDDEPDDGTGSSS